MANFYVIGTPIGNLEDITLRAISVLKSADLILCEDTRTTRTLLNKYDIHTQTMSYHVKSKIEKIDHIITLLEEGKNIALVSDAGTPCISDPGVMLVAKIRAHFSAKETSSAPVIISAIPGPSALVSALSISGLPASDFLFLGFLPHKKGRETLFKEIASSTRTVAFYESPHRILKTLESLAKHTPDRKIVIARELTKFFEEVLEGRASELTEIFTKTPEKVRGEFVVMVAPL
ncbi:MAG: 16S rRNA (cytidine(1402)-2'-O)-methyltransferase [Candidatus Taylorbacteria bacterium]|nr:16S rRNA (cytidine(1402)-2'-O)-methyltransferase [Candidatus Taylorbacteria bacterium]